jgi:Type II CAAX prenyl endopeptidase Rce1-like
VAGRAASQSGRPGRDVAFAVATAAALTWYGRQLAYHVLLRIPVGTVRWEEVAFRAVLPAALHRGLPRPAAIAVVSALFGAWHIRPTADALRENQLAAGRTAWVAAVAAAPTPRPSGRTSPRSPAGQSPRPC